MNKLKPYQEPESTQAYALQILACHVLEAEIRAKKTHIHERDDPTQPQDTSFSHHDGGTTLAVKPTPYPDQATLDAEDLEIHQIMLEGYWAQPSPLRNDISQHQGYDAINPLKGSKATLGSQPTCRPLGTLKQIPKRSVKVYKDFSREGVPHPTTTRKGKGGATH